jgi:hypothetical protein
MVPPDMAQQGMALPFVLSFVAFLCKFERAVRACSCVVCTWVNVNKVYSDQKVICHDIKHM